MHAALKGDGRSCAIARGAYSWTASERPRYLPRDRDGFAISLTKGGLIILPTNWAPPYNSYSHTKFLPSPGCVSELWEYELYGGAQLAPHRLYVFARLLTQYALVGVSISRDLVCLLVRRSLLSLGPGAEGRSHYLLRWWLALRLPPRAELRAADEERTRVQGGSADLVRDHASRLRIRIIYSKPHSSSLSVNLSLGLALS
eukprot:scaffold12300_cov132-Isochrysis_galbana.AAC.12